MLCSWVQCFYSTKAQLFFIPHQVNHTLFVYVCLAGFAKHNALQNHLYSCKWPDFLSRYEWAVVSVYIFHTFLIHSFASGNTSLCLGCCDRDTVDVGGQRWLHTAFISSRYKPTIASWHRNCGNWYNHYGKEHRDSLKLKIEPPPIPILYVFSLL